MRKLSNAYLNFVAAKGTGPTNEKELRKYLECWNPGTVSNGDGQPMSSKDVFRSERDGECFVIRYRLGISQETGIDAPLIAFEKEGIDGSYYVAFANGKVSCISKEVFDELRE